MIRILAGISVFIGFCALPVSLPAALTLIIIGGLIMFIGDTKKEKNENNKVYEDMASNFEKKGLYTKLNNKQKKKK
mgnify:FL=1|jgi:hypothetical protein|tara:strand:+ start:397 stop:624 length:228 start_codon:yes stop_codon:yes gene_type:complete